MRLGRPAETKGWSTSNGIQVTLTALEGRARGTWSGTLETPDATNPGDAPVTVENGRFDVVITVGSLPTLAEPDAGR
jgi:hypothetical protein